MLNDEELMHMFRNTFNPSQAYDSWTDMNDQAGNILLIYSLVYQLNAMNVCEIGVNDGTSTLAILKALGDLGGNRLLTSVDVAECNTAIKMVEDYGYSHLWEFHHKDSHEWTREHAHPEAGYDLLFIDGDHSHKGSQDDVIQLEKHLKDKGLILFHDCWFTGDPDGGCKLTADWLDSRPDLRGIIFPFACNLGVFQKR